MMLTIGRNGRNKGGILFVQMVVFAVTALTSVAFALSTDTTVWPSEPSTFEQSLDARILNFDTLRRPPFQSILELAYQYHLPMAIEYLDGSAFHPPSKVNLQNTSPREVISALVAQLPGYSVSFADGIIDIYSPSARRDASNLLNVRIDNFDVRELDTEIASAELVKALSRKLDSHKSMMFSVAAGSAGTKKITLHLQNVPVYIILNALIAQNGAAIWLVQHKPDDLKKIEGLWHVYSLDPPFQAIVLEKTTRLFPNQN